MGSETISATPPAPLAQLYSGGQEDVWLGFKRHTFTVDGCTCWLVEPKVPAPGHPWVWSMMFPAMFAERTGVPALLGHGYYYAYMSVGDTFGAPSALAHLTAFHRALTGAGLRSKAVLMGLSRGGLYAYNWAAQNPDKVSVIYGDAPVCNFQSWPYGEGAGRHSDEWKLLLATYGFKTDAEALACPTQPIREMAPIARARIALITVVGDVDTNVPCLQNTALIEQECKALGLPITVIHKPTGAHHPHGLTDPTPVVAFILEHNR